MVCGHLQYYIHGYIFKNISSRNRLLLKQSSNFGNGHFSNMCVHWDCQKSLDVKFLHIFKIICPESIADKALNSEQIYEARFLSGFEFQSHWSCVG